MNTVRLLFRNRTRKLITDMLSYSQERQMLFFGFETIEQLEFSLIRIEKGLAKDNNEYCIFDLIKRKDNIVIGSCGFHNWSKDHARSEIGYEIHPKYQNKGYMGEAIKEVINYGFKEMNLNRIEALIGPTNKKSIKIIENNKFQKEGVMREHYKKENEFEDSVMYSLLKSEYNI